MHKKRFEYVTMVPVPQRASPALPPLPSVVKLPPTGSHMLPPGDPESQPRAPVPGTLLHFYGQSPKLLQYPHPMCYDPKHSWQEQRERGRRVGRPPHAETNSAARVLPTLTALLLDSTLRELRHNLRGVNLLIVTTVLLSLPPVLPCPPTQPTVAAATIRDPF